MKVIVGLGNPGKEYKMTRHNLGFLVVDQLANEIGTFRKQRKFNAVLLNGKIGEQPIILVKPLTYMNFSGSAVKKVCEYYHLPPSELIIVHDDLDLDFGRIKIKRGGGDAGHKGIRSLIDYLGSDAFIRIRIGIGKPEEKKDTVDYVLSPFKESEFVKLPQILEQAINIIQFLVIKGLEAAMNTFNKAKRI